MRTDRVVSLVALVLAFAAGTFLMAHGVVTGSSEATLCAVGVWSAALARLPRSRSSRERDTDEHEIEGDQNDRRRPRGRS